MLPLEGINVSPGTIGEKVWIAGLLLPDPWLRRSAYLALNSLASCPMTWDEWDINNPLGSIRNAAANHERKITAPEASQIISSLNKLGLLEFSDRASNSPSGIPTASDPRRKFRSKTVALSDSSTNLKD